MPKNDYTKINIDESDELLIKRDIREKANRSLAKKDTLVNMEALDDLLMKQEKARAKEREEFYKNKALTETAVAGRAKRHEVKGTSRKQSGKDDIDVTVYKAKAAAKNADKKNRKVRREGVIHRTIRLFKGLSRVRKQIKTSDTPIPYEKRRKLVMGVFNDAWAPLMNELRNLIDNLWDFIVHFWDDFSYLLLTLFDLFITAGYYVGSFAIFLWDCTWDIRLWFEDRKRSIFQYFSAAAAVVAMILILISSMSAYEYTYYGKTLGITRSKQDIYQTIDALGDKLSEATGANINFNVERDIEFNRVYGFRLDIDSPEDILNTLTYMKDIQVRAFAINVDDESVVVLEDEETANGVLTAIKNDYAPILPGVEYTLVSYKQKVTVDEVGVLLGDIWNPQDAVRYLETGNVHELAEDDVANPVITVETIETATYDKEINFGSRYIESSEFYVDETELISAGIKGVDRIVAEVHRINGEETNREILSTDRIKNPVDAVLYQGTKPLPEKKGTGTFIWPLKSYIISSRFGGRETGIIGASTNHQGIDLAASSGSKIYASDGGTVTFAGWQSGYGYVIFIDHGGLYETRYGHCSRLLVKVGEKVYQGQNIALVGNTGVSSGPHLHFEVRYKGTANNPLKYLP